jgi:hypothetical protein
LHFFYFKRMRYWPVTALTLVLATNQVLRMRC